MTLGLQRGTVKLVPYDPEWAVIFMEERQRIFESLGDAALGVEHIGSTAIPGMDAKPILDLMVAISTVDDYEQYVVPLEKLGYVFRRDMRNDQEHVLFVKGPEEKRTHYLKLTTLNSDFWREHLLFRDFLRLHPERAESYRRLKHALLEEYAGERAEYTKEKSGFIKETIKLAMQTF